MPGMDEKRTARLIAIWLIAVFAFVPLYLLSTGPAVLLRDRGVLSQEAMQRVYAPVGWLYNHVPFFAQAMESYLRLWSSGPGS